MMSGPELPCKIYSSEEILACLRKTTKRVDVLRLHINKVHNQNQTMYNYMVTQFQNIKHQMQPLEVPVSDISLSKVTFQDIFVWADLDPHLDNVQVIALVLIKPSNHDPHTSCL